MYNCNTNIIVNTTTMVFKDDGIIQHTYMTRNKVYEIIAGGFLCTSLSALEFILLGEIQTAF